MGLVLGRHRLSADAATAGLSQRAKQLDSAQRLEDLAAVPDNRLEALAGDRKGQHSIRVNQQYRITFRWERHDAYDVCCEDYH